jgi:hypothetical protein
MVGQNVEAIHLSGERCRTKRKSKSTVGIEVVGRNKTTVNKSHEFVLRQAVI